MTHKALIRQLEISCLGLDRIDPLRLLVDDVIEALRENAMREVQRLGQEIEQEPVAKVDANDEGYWAEILPDRSVKVGQLLYTTPPQRTWVDLTDDEIKKISKKHKWHESNVAPHLMPVYRSLEAKLKEKNT